MSSGQPGPADDVGDHRHPLAAKRLAEVFRGAGHDRVRAETGHLGVLGLRGHRDHPRAAAPGKLDQRAPHAPRGAGDEHGVAGADVRAVQHALRRRVGAGEGRELGVRQPGVDDRHVARVALGVLGEAPVDLRPEVAGLVQVPGVRPVALPAVDHDPPAEEGGVGARSDRDHLPHRVRPLDPRKPDGPSAPGRIRLVDLGVGVAGRRLRHRPGVPARAGVDVRVVEPAGADADERLHRPRLGSRPVFAPLVLLEAAVAGEHHRLHCTLHSTPFMD